MNSSTPGRPQNRPAARSGNATADQRPRSRRPDAADATDPDAPMGRPQEDEPPESAGDDQYVPV